jgi:hypothetical protein
MNAGLLIGFLPASYSYFDNIERLKQMIERRFTSRVSNLRRRGSLRRKKQWSSNRAETRLYFSPAMNAHLKSEVLLLRKLLVCVSAVGARHVVPLQL